MAMSMEPFNRLVRLVARAFYDDITMKGENQPKNGRSDNRGMAVVVLDALTRRQWVREEDLAKSLKLHSKQLRRTLRFFEEEKLVTRDHRKETAKGAKIFSAAVAAATADGKKIVREGDEKVKLHTHSYCCLDYAQIYDVVRFRIHRMKKKLKDELDSRNTIQEYICPACKRRYSALDVLQLISPTGEHFVCERCNNEIIAESDKLASQEMGDGDENARRRHREKLKEMLQKIETQLKPLTQQINRVKDLPVPDFGSLQAWEARANAAGLLNGESGGNDPNRANQGQGYGGTPMPYLGETKVEVALSGAEVKGEENNGADPGSPMKQLPPWMIQEGMNLTEEQRRGRSEVKSDSKMVSSSTSTYDIDEKKPNDVKEEDKSIRDEYIKAYYAAIVKRQEELEMQQKAQNELFGGDVSNVQATHPGRQVGMKAKREDDDVEWEEAPTPAVANGATKVNDLNMPANESENEDDDDDGVDWEEG